MATDIVQGIDRAYAERTDFLVVALTGRTGSGCTTTANVLNRSFASIPIFEGGDTVEPSDVRKMSIAKTFLSKHWVPFQTITVSSIIFGFLIRAKSTEVSNFLTELQVSQEAIDAVLKIRDELQASEGFPEFLAIVDSNEWDKRSKAWRFYATKLQPAASKARAALKSKYAPVFQTLGDNLRSSGNAFVKEVDSSELFSLIQCVKRLAKAAFYYNKERGQASTRIVIDAIRNPLELVYLRDQFAAFYSIAVTADDSDRISRLEVALNKQQISEIDEKEYSSRSKSLSNYEAFVSQDIRECIQKSDIFIANPGHQGELAQNSRHINTQIVRYVALMLRPGLVTPTRDERCMQLAFVAKLNSGCISRQVGAAVADSNYSIKSVGWNDVPKGQTPCLLRSVEDLLSGGDSQSFSDFEKKDDALHNDLTQQFSSRKALATQTGLACPFCFKDAYNRTKSEKNQVHTRSLHAEENAFLQLAKYGSSGINGGVLYTTASPCELCSKKAFQLGISEVVFVDPYPGISATHILGFGPTDSRPKLRLFSGAIGHAYHRLYESILPIKDEFSARLRD